MKNTKQEAKFFSIAEAIYLNFDDQFDFEKIDIELSFIVEKFQTEIIENCTNLSEKEREFYLNRLKNRLHPIGLDYYFIEKKDGQFIEKDDGTLSVEKGKEIEYEQLIEINGMKQFRLLLKRYQRILLRLITEITTDRNKPEPERLADHSKLLKALKEYITGINSNEFTNIIEHHSTTPGTPPARWIGKPVDAYRFATFIKMKIPDFNKCFSLSKDRELKHSDKNDSDAPIIEILKTHLSK